MKGIEKGFKRARSTIISVILAGATLVGVGVGVRHYQKKKDADGLTSPSTTTEAPAKTESELVLSADFDVNDDDAVRKRAEDIYKFSEKKYPVEDIMNTIYLLHKKGDKIIFEADLATEAEKFEYLHNLFVVFSDVLLINDTSEKGLLALKEDDGRTVFYDETPIYSYMFLANPGKGKDMALELAGLVNKQLKGVSEGESESILTENAKKFHDFYFEIGEANLSSQESYALYADVRSKSGPFVNYLSEKEKNAIMVAGNVNLDSDVVKNDIIKAAGLKDALNEALLEGFEKGDLSKKISGPSERYRESDAKVANKYGAKSEVYETPKVVQSGGNKVNSGSVVTVRPNKPTTTRKDESVVSIPNGGTHTEIITGGKPVEEGPTVTRPARPTTTKPSTTKPTPTYSDDETMPVYTPDEFEALNGYSKTLK